MEDAFPRGLYRLPDRQADPAQAWLGAFAVALILIVLAQWLAPNTWRNASPSGPR